MNINGFLDNFLGGARSDLFEVWIDFPEVVKTKILASLATTTAKTVMEQAFTGTLAGVYNVTNNALSDLFSTVTGGYGRYLAKSAKLPKSSISTADVQYKGRKFPFPTTRNDDTSIPIDFYNDANFLIRNSLEIWSQMMRTTQTNVGYYPMHMFGTIKVYQHDSLGNILKVHKFVNAFPTEVGEIALNWDSENIETFSTAWSYHYALSDTSDKGI